MTQDDLKSFFEILQGCMEVYNPERKLTPAASNIWFEALKAYPLKDISLALTSHLSDPENGRFAPKPADILRYLTLSAETAALKAWTKIDKTIRQVGRERSVVFDDPLIHAVIDEMGGWIKLCEAPDEKSLEFMGYDFKKRYQAGLHHPVGQYPRILMGFAQLQNVSNGYRAPVPQTPALIGDRQGIDQVLKAGHVLPSVQPSLLENQRREVLALAN